MVVNEQGRCCAPDARVLHARTRAGMSQAGGGAKPQVNRRSRTPVIPLPIRHHTHVSLIGECPRRGGHSPGIFYILSCPLRHVLLFVPMHGVPGETRTAPGASRKRAAQRRAQSTPRAELAPKRTPPPFPRLRPPAMVPPLPPPPRAAPMTCPSSSEVAAVAQLSVVEMAAAPPRPR